MRKVGLALFALVIIFIWEYRKHLGKQIYVFPGKCVFQDLDKPSSIAYFLFKICLNLMACHYTHKKRLRQIYVSDLNFTQAMIFSSLFLWTIGKRLWSKVHPPPFHKKYAFLPSKLICKYQRVCIWRETKTKKMQPHKIWWLCCSAAVADRDIEIQ